VSEVALYGFQVAEILDSIWAVWCGTLLVIGLGLWFHGTYVRKD